MRRRRPAIRSLRVGIDKPTVIELKEPVSRGCANLLHILGEFPNRLVSVNDLCDRLQVTDMAVRVRAHRVRKSLTSDWTLQCHDRAYRLIDLRDK